MLVCIGLDWDQEEDEEGSSTDQQGGTDGLMVRIGEKNRGHKRPFLKCVSRRACG